jgi:hypothetical protein
MKIKRLVLPLAILFSGLAIAQDPAKSSEKREATIQLAYYKKADMTRTAVATVKARDKEGKFASTKNARVSFYVTQDKNLQLLQKVVTNAKGQATILLQGNLPVDTGRFFTITAKIENDSLYEDAEEKVRYKDVNLTLTLNPKDTAQNASVLVTQTGKDGKEVPVKDVDVKFYVQRLFGNMPAADDYTVTTDENGTATFKYPKGIPGDTLGNLNVVARIEDNDKFGNIESKTNATWGAPLIVDKDPFPRALWEPYAPFPLVITISILFGGVWITYFIIFSQMVKIKKEGKKAV